MVADGVLPAGEADQAGGVDEPFDLDGAPGWGPVVIGGRPAGQPSSVRSCRRLAEVSRDGTVLSRTPLMSRWTTVASAQRVTGSPARVGLSQNCCPQTVRLPEAERDG